MNDRTHTHTHTPLPGALDAPPQSNLFTLSRRCSCRRWGGSRLQSRKPARGQAGGGHEAVPAPALRLPQGARAPRPLLLLPRFAATPAAEPAALPPVPAGRGRRGRGAARNLRQLLPPWPATLRIALERGSRPRGAVRSGHGAKGHAARGESPASSKRARPPPSHPARKARSPRRARQARGRRPGPGRGLLHGGPGTARSPAGRSSGVRPGLAPAQRRTDARPSERGGIRGVTTLRSPRRSLRLLPGTQGFRSSGHGGGFPGPSSALPPRLGVGLLLPTPRRTAELRYLIILLLLLPAPAGLLCRSRRFPVSHVEERREADWQSVGDYLW